jgi:hypothetical protein
VAAPQQIVITGLGPVIHAVPPDHHRKHQFRRCHVDARVKRGHDGQEETGPRKSAMNHFFLDLRTTLIIISGISRSHRSEMP